MAMADFVRVHHIIPSTDAAHIMSIQASVEIALASASHGSSAAARFPIFIAVRSVIPNLFCVLRADGRADCAQSPMTRIAAPG